MSTFIEKEIEKFKDDFWKEVDKWENDNKDGREEVDVYIDFGKSFLLSSHLRLLAELEKKVMEKLEYVSYIKWNDTKYLNDEEVHQKIAEVFSKVLNK